MPPKSRTGTPADVAVSTSRRTFCGVESATRNATRPPRDWAIRSEGPSSSARTIDTRSFRPLTFGSCGSFPSPGQAKKCRSCPGSSKSATGRQNEALAPAPGRNSILVTWQSPQKSADKVPLRHPPRSTAPGQDRVELVDHLRNLLPRQIERWHEAQCVRPRRVQEQTRFERLRYDRSPNGQLQVEREQQSAAANFAKAMPCRELLQLGFETLPGLGRGSQERRLGHLLQHGEADRAHQWIAVEGATLIAVLEAGGASGRKQGRERHAAADAFAQRHDVGRDARVLVMEELSSAAHTGLDFVDDQEQAVVV